MRRTFCIGKHLCLGRTTAVSDAGMDRMRLIRAHDMLVFSPSLRASAFEGGVFTAKLTFREFQLFIVVLALRHA